MASWFVFESAKTTPDTLAAADKSVFVKDGFSIGAFLVTPVWLLWRRMWMVFLFWVAAQIALALLARVLDVDDRITGIVSLLFSLCFALEANALRAWTMRRQGWRLTGIASGHTLDEAELRHFEDRIITPPAQAAVPPPAASVHASRIGHDSGYDSGQQNVLGVFPEPHGTRP